MTRYVVVRDEESGPDDKARRVHQDDPIHGKVRDDVDLLPFGRFVRPKPVP